MSDDASDQSSYALRGTTNALKIRGVHHITLVVSDLERSRPFYEKLLGLAPISRPEYDFEGAWYACGGLEVHLLVQRSTRVLSEDILPLRYRISSMSSPVWIGYGVGSSEVPAHVPTMAVASYSVRTPMGI